MSYIEVKDIHKSFTLKTNGHRKSFPVLHDLSFEINRGEFVTCFGPNGCGKTTLLNVVAGLLSPDKGIALIAKKHSIDAKVGFVFQNYRDSLFPWKNVMQNLAFPLELRGISKKDSFSKIDKFFSLIDIDIPFNQYVYELSGGQQQLVAIIRSLIYEPDVLIMDEPFGSLDYETRLHMQNTLLQLWEKTETTVLFVSHEIDEAIYLADKVLILTKRPATIADILHVDLPRPRVHDILASPKFANYKSRLLSAFE